MKKLFFSMVLLLVLIIPVVANVQPFDPILSGERNIGQDYRVTVNNVSGLADITYHFSVYDYRIIGDKYVYYSPNWGQWFTHPADESQKYLAVWVRVEGEGNTSWYGWGHDRFKLWVWGNTTIDPEAVPLQDLPIEYKSNKYLPAVIAELQDLKDRNRSRLTTEWYGWKDGIQLDRQEPGPSAAWDGVILFQIPEPATADDIRVLGWTWYGYGVWYLTPHEDLIQAQPSASTNAAPAIQKPAVVVRGKNTVEDQKKKSISNKRTGVR